MNANAAAILTDPHPYGHIVYPYTDEALVGQAAALFAGAGLRNGEGVILVMTAAHRNSITLRLVTEGYDVENFQRSGRLICITAEDFIAGFMRDGVPDEEIFSAVIEELIKSCRASAGRATGQVRVFCEMVSMLWKSDLTATISLEEIWNRIIDRNSVSLMCTYALNGRDGIPDSLHSLHSHSVECADVAAQALS
jgi:KaiC/GvpD/RAD55 family RecA-like ATPase